MSAYLFILALEYLFIKVRENENIHRIEIFDFEFKISAFADYASYLVTDLQSAGHLWRLFSTFAQRSSLKINREKSELCGIGSLKGVKRVFHRFKVLHLTHESIKIFGCHHSYDASHQNLSVLLENIQAVLNLWRTRDLSVEGKIPVFKTLGLSKMQYLAMMSNVPNSMIETLKVIHNNFLWSSKPARVKQTTLIGNYSDDGVKDVDIVSKLKALKMTWITYMENNS